MKRIIFIILSILIGVVFIFSGYSKLFPIEPFQFNFISVGIANWITAPILARFVISLEFFLGILLILNYKLTQFTLKVVLGLLMCFTLYLIYQFMAEGNNGNCGCFGEMLKMTPLESIIKNLVLITLVVILMFNRHHVEWMWGNNIYWIVAMAACGTTLALNPFDYNAAQIVKNDIVNLPLRLDTLYHSPNAYPPPAIDLKKGKHIICFLSLKCQHCINSAFKMNLIKKQMPSVPFYYVYGGYRKDLKYFEEKSKYINIPYTLFEDNYFFTLCGGKYPAIYYTEDGIIKQKGNIYTLDADEIKNWLKG